VLNWGASAGYNSPLGAAAKYRFFKRDASTESSFSLNINLGALPGLKRTGSEFKWMIGPVKDFFGTNKSGVFISYKSSASIEYWPCTNNKDGWSLTSRGKTFEVKPIKLNKYIKIKEIYEGFRKK
jgi:hypothetical protein